MFHPSLPRAACWPPLLDRAWQIGGRRLLCHLGPTACAGSTEAPACRGPTALRRLVLLRCSTGRAVCTEGRGTSPCVSQRAAPWTSSLPADAQRVYRSTVIKADQLFQHFPSTVIMILEIARIAIDSGTLPVFVIRQSSLCVSHLFVCDRHTTCHYANSGLVNTQHQHPIMRLFIYMFVVS